MFNLFDKKEVAPKAGDSSGQLPAAAANEPESDIVVHVMPEHFRLAHADASKAKTTGIMILVGGLVFLLLISSGLYYFLFKYQPNAKTDTAKNQEVKPPPRATSTDESSALTDNQFATSSIATGSLEVIATTTEVVATTTATSSEAINDEIASSTSYTFAIDSDGDSLTDEEESILGTNNLSQDSDADGYSDLSELRQLYNPAGAGKLEASQRIKKYTGQFFSMLYPAVWNEKTTGGDFAVMFSAADNQLVQISVEPNVSGSDIVSWYKQEFKVTDVKAAQFLEKRDSNGGLAWNGVVSDDGLTIYLADTQKNNIYTINYNLGLGTVITYPNILKMAADSLTFIK